MWNCGKAEELRLFGIDCPERRHYFGTKAGKFTSKMVFGKVVDVEPVERDRYGRTVAWVSVNGKSLTKELLQRQANREQLAVAAPRTVELQSNWQSVFSHTHRYGQPRNPGVAARISIADKGRKGRHFLAVEHGFLIVADWRRCQRHRRESHRRNLVLGKIVGVSLHLQ